MLRRRRNHDRAERPTRPRPALQPVPVPPPDPLHGVLLQKGSPVLLDELRLSSPALDALRRSGAAIVVPLIASGELLGTIAVGPRLSEEPFSTDDQRLLARLASQTAPAVKVASVVRERQEEAQERERLQHELEVAALIQQTLLPRELPNPAGWHIDAFYRPAREVGGDFYDVIPLDDHRLAFVIGDVTDKGVPAALVMATTRAHLQAATRRGGEPGEVLAEVNEILVGEIPARMFVTCLYGILDTGSGTIRFANAGHNLPYICGGRQVEAVRATGMPLGLMGAMDYEEQTAVIAEGGSLVLTSDGITETHAADGQMYGLPGIEAALRSAPEDGLIDHVLRDLDDFAATPEAPDDDLTMVTLRRTCAGGERTGDPFVPRLLSEFAVASRSGNERLVMERVSAVVEPLGLPARRMERLRTAVAEAAMNAIEHGNAVDPDLDVEVQVLASECELVVRIRDHGRDHLALLPEIPDLEAKLAGAQRPRGWGIFLIKEMVDELIVGPDGQQGTVQLVMRRSERR